MAHTKEFMGAPFRRAGKSKKQCANNLNCKLNVNEEYMGVFRTKSYVEMWSKAQGELGETNLDKLSTSSSSPSFPLQTHLTECLLEPRQETLLQMMESLNFHHLIINFFEASLEACNMCELLLRGIHQARANYQIIKRVLNTSKQFNNFVTDYPDELYSEIYQELARFALCKNPLSIISPAQYRKVHDGNMVLLHRLTSKHKKIRRRAKFNRFCKKVGGYSLVISHSALVIGLLVISLHSIVGLLAAPGLLGFLLCLFKKKTKTEPQVRSRLETLGAQLDIAAKGIFILINDFDTVSRLVRRLRDELDHHKAVSNMCVRSGNHEVLREVVQEFRMHESRFIDQLEELEEHLYLSFHTINRSRRLVLDEMMGFQI